MYTKLQEQLEHIQSEIFLIKWMNSSISQNRPHGEPIPDKDGIINSKILKLSECKIIEMVILLCYYFYR